MNAATLPQWPDALESKLDGGWKVVDGIFVAPGKDVV